MPAMPSRAVAPSVPPVPVDAVPLLDHDEIVARATELVPALRERAQRAETLRCLPDETMAEVEAAGAGSGAAPGADGAPTSPSAGHSAESP